MRSFFTVNISPSNDSYPTDEQILNVVRSFGWEPTEAKKYDEDKKIDYYKSMAETLFSEMPEIAQQEKDKLIFYGFFADDQTKFVITRVVEGQITFRLLHPELPKLQNSTDKIIRKLIKTSVNDTVLDISDRKVVIYERGQDHMILKGRVVPSAIREAIRVNRKDVLLVVFPLALFLITIFMYSTKPLESHNFFSGTMERFSTAMLTTTLVSFLGLLHTYWEILRSSIISWSFFTDGNK